MKRIGFLLGLAGLILLDWAALHDLLAEEPDLRMEWAVLRLSGLACVLLLWKVGVLRQREQQ